MLFQYLSYFFSPNLKDPWKSTSKWLPFKMDPKWAEPMDHISSACNMVGWCGNIARISRLKIGLFLVDKSSANDKRWRVRETSEKRYLASQGYFVKIPLFIIDRFSKTTALIFFFFFCLDCRLMIWPESKINSL